MNMNIEQRRSPVRLRRFALIYGLAAMVALVIVSFPACTTGPTGVVSSIFFPDRNVSFSAHVKPFLNESCAQSGCHDEFTRAGNLSVVTYTDLLRNPGTISPGDSSSSVLCQILSERLPHTQPIIQFSTLNQRRGVCIWIQEGSFNN